VKREPGTGHPPTRIEITMRKTMASAVALSAAVLGLGIAGPAAADTLRVTDPMDTFHGSDLLDVRVRNGDRNVVVTTTHYGLRRDPRTGSSGAVFIDTDRRDPGPEYVFVGGYFAGTDYALLHTEGFHHRTWGEPVRGSYRMRIDYADEQVRMRMSRRALGRPDDVRIAVRVVGTRTDGSSHGLVDWLGERRSFTRWIDKG
jgi:hypothetical protein